MTRTYKILISILALVFSVGATCIGFILVGSLSLGFWTRIFYNFFFLMQTVATCWTLIGLFRKEK